MMGEIEGSYRVLQTPGTRLGAQFNAGISTLEPGQSISVAGVKGQDKGLQLRVQGLDESVDFYDLEGIEALATKGETAHQPFQ
ncbi:hypothetical protein GJAV_G00114090 [Gymnothorax javanicus]|nr:hypothetical protein GJAV_G00114090 [Gymnothorax javanicus]